MGISLLFEIYFFQHAASYQGSPGAKNETDPNNTTVGT